MDFGYWFVVYYCKFKLISCCEILSVFICLTNRCAITDVSTFICLGYPTKFKLCANLIWCGYVWQITDVNTFICLAFLSCYSYIIYDTINYYLFSLLFYRSAFLPIAYDLSSSKVVIPTSLATYSLWFTCVKLLGVIVLVLNCSSLRLSLMW
jgi:hypothetical protein